jgi:prepilin-type processing-associated H-X9-DG protein
MKVLMCVWVDKPSNLPEWFKEDEEAEISWEQIGELYATGCQVMVKHASGSNILFVDAKAFTVR